MLDTIDDILGESSTGVADHSQPIRPISNHSTHSQNYSVYAPSVSPYGSESSSVLTSPVYIQNSNNFEHTQTLQEYQSVINLGNIEQVQINPNTTCIPIDMQEYLTKNNIYIYMYRISVF